MMLYEKLEREYLEAKASGDTTTALCLGLLRAHAQRLHRAAQRSLSDEEIKAEAQRIISRVRHVDNATSYHKSMVELLTPYSDYESKSTVIDEPPVQLDCTMDLALDDTPTHIKMDMVAPTELLPDTNNKTETTSVKPDNTEKKPVATAEEKPAVKPKTSKKRKRKSDEASTKKK